MKVYDITIKPVSGFGTPLKGDTIFGHFCWQIAHDESLAEKPLSDLISQYSEKPFAVFSSAFPKLCFGSKYLYAFKSPSLPPDKLFNIPGNKKERIEKRKEYKAKIWMMIEEGQKLFSFKDKGIDFLTDKELLIKAESILSEKTKKDLQKASMKGLTTGFTQPHNTINRLTATTGGDAFAPYAVDQQVFLPETELALFVGIDDELITIEQVKEGIEKIGAFGFGKDASTGLGKFELGEDTEIDLAEMGSDNPDACYTLAPCVPERDIFEETFFTSFTRFGRHGDRLANSANPFKNPVIMADEGAVFKPKESSIFNKPYIGRAVSGVSKIQQKAVTQGYSLFIPVNLEV